MGSKRDEDIIIGGNIRKFREFLGLSRKQLSENLNITEDSLYRMEHGDKGVISTYAYSLAQKYNCDMNFIYGITDIPRVITCEETQKASVKEIARMLRYYAEILECTSKEETEKVNE